MAKSLPGHRMNIYAEINKADKSFRDKIYLFSFPPPPKVPIGETDQKMNKNRYFRCNRRKYYYNHSLTLFRRNTQTMAKALIVIKKFIRFRMKNQ
jgi:hypothetical protein